MIVFLKDSPDIHSDHIFSVRLLNHVVCRVATSERNVHIASSDDVSFIIVNGVGEHDVSLIRCLQVKTKKRTSHTQRVKYSIIRT